MPNTDANREDDLRQLLTDAVEVQLAALKAGISFWSEWIEHTSTFVQSATEALSSITTEDPKSRDVVLELLDAGRASLRSLTEIPKHTATHFVAELDRLAAQRAAAPRATAAKRSKTATTTKTTTTTGARKAATRRKRAGRAKA